jgi:hypothetical protein
MANNRMAIVCKHCNLGISIAKYYPLGGFIGGEDTKENAGWYTNGDNSRVIDDFFIRHNHGGDNTNWGESQYFLGYENDGKKWQYDTKK